MVDDGSDQVFPGRHGDEEHPDIDARDLALAAVAGLRRHFDELGLVDVVEHEQIPDDVGREKGGGRLGLLLVSALSPACQDDHCVANT